MKDRIKQLMEAQQMTQHNFAQVLGISPATLSQILSGKVNPNLNHVEALRKCFPSISYSWLLDGSGPMFHLTPQQGAQSAHEQPLFTEDGQANIISAIAPIPTPVAKKEEPQKQAPLYEPVPSKFEARKVEEKNERKIREIVIYYNNNTFETFIPKGEK